MIGGPYRVLILPTDPGGWAEYAGRLGGRVGYNVAMLDPPRPGDMAGWQQLAEDSVRTEVGLVVLDTLLGTTPRPTSTKAGRWA